MVKERISTKAKKIVRWHNNYVVFVTPEAKELKWDDKTIVRVFIDKDSQGKKRIIIEEGMRL